MKKRIWELDAARGIALMGMIVIHLIYDLVDLFGILRWNLPQGYLLFKNNYGLLFLVISGISVTLGSHSARRGIQVFCCGFLCTAVTYGMYLMNFAGKGIIIYFGVLQCLGVCMLLWSAFRRLPNWLLAGLGITFVAVGLYLRGCSFETPWLIPIGFTPRWFASSDYFPLLPNFGYFLLGSVIGRTVYRKKESILSKIDPDTPVLRFFCACGRNSLLIYLLHQPILAAVCAVITLF